MSNLWKQIKDYVEHAFHWLIIVKALTRMFQRELLEEYEQLQQLKRDRLNLFKDGLTQLYCNVNILP